MRLLGFRALAAGWSTWWQRFGSDSRRRGIDFLVEYLSRHHPELL